MHAQRVGVIGGSKFHLALGTIAVLFLSSSALVYIFDSCSIATNWDFPMFEDGACGAGFCKAKVNSCAAMMAFSAEYL